MILILGKENENADDYDQVFKNGYEYSVTWREGGVIQNKADGNMQEHGF